MRREASNQTSAVARKPPGEMGPGGRESAVPSVSSTRAPGETVTAETAPREVPSASWSVPASTASAPPMLSGRQRRSVPAPRLRSERFVWFCAGQREARTSRTAPALTSITASCERGARWTLAASTVAVDAPVSEPGTTVTVRLKS